ncbi:hypothetical protein MTO96_050203 [Rhipicephalus appendiculatus]
MAAINLAADLIEDFPAIQRAAILTDSRAALAALEQGETGSPLARGSTGNYKPFKPPAAALSYIGYPPTSVFLAMKPRTPQLNRPTPLKPRSAISSTLATSTDSSSPAT